MNHRVGHGLKIPIVYRFVGHTNAVAWVAKKITVEEAKLAQLLEKVTW